MNNSNFTYLKSGVDIQKTTKLVKFISKLSKSTKIKGSEIRNFKNIGGFGSVFDLGQYKIKNPLIVTSTDGVGTKLEIANHLNDFRTIGIDLVAMCVNDLIVQGAKPVVFLDYIAIQKVIEKKYKQILSGIAKGCRIAGCSLSGGETAEMPGVYTGDSFDLAGFAVGIVGKKNVITGNSIKHGDIVLGVPSSGAHSNGYSLIRKILKDKKIKIKNPLIVTSTDGVGTKLEIANHLNDFRTIGIDLVAMCVNDLIVQGAKPVVFLDYIAIPKVIEKKYKQILSGIAKGCRIAGCSLSGGETAEMPGVYMGDSFDLAGFAVGIVGKKNVITGNSIKHGDIILGVPSTGAHSNGYSLIRKILKDKKIKVKNNKKLYKELLTPTKIYVKEILKLHSMKLIKGCAHITGGGIVENLPRVIPDNYSARINLSKIKPNKVIKWIKSHGVDDHEMLKTFNCGVGFCIITDKKNYKKIFNVFNKSSKPYEIGTIIKSNNNNKIILNEKVNWRY